jgi:hypothetical protein
MTNRWVGLGLIVATLSWAGPARAQGQPGAFAPAPPAPPAPQGPFGAPGAFGATPPSPAPPSGPFGAPGAFLPPQTSPGGYGGGGAFVPTTPGAFSGGPVCPPEGASEVPCPDERPCYRDLFGKSERGCCEPCFSVWAEYLLLWSKGNRLAFPTLTSGNINDPVPAALGQPNTQVILGTSGYVYPVNSAYRGGATFWFSPNCLAADLNFFYAQNSQNTFAANLTGAPNSLVIARPFFNTGFGVEDSDPRSVPGALGGSVSQQFSTRLFGGEANVRWVVNDCGAACYCPVLSFLGGFRQLKLDDTFAINDRVTQLPFTTGTTTAISDTFTTYNQFYGGQIGASLGCRWDERLFTTVTGKVAYGSDYQTIHVNGNTVVTGVNGNILAQDGIGLYAQRSNIGTYHHTTGIVVPEVDVNTSVDINEHIHFKLGYSFIYMNRIIRPGDQMDRNVNPQPLGIAPGALGSTAHPAPPLFATTDFWFQFVNIGLEFTF